MCMNPSERAHTCRTIEHGHGRGITLIDPFILVGSLRLETTIRGRAMALIAAVSLLTQTVSRFDQVLQHVC